MPRHRQPGNGFLQADGITRRPFWLPGIKPSTAAWLHHPSDGMVRLTGVLICPSFGFEYTHGHRTLIHLADDLAHVGFASLRIDYPGTGDSEGDESLPALAEAWLQTIGDALEFLQQLTHGVPAAVGIRLGALLTGTISESHPLEAWVAWSPVVSGRRFTREISALHRIGGSSPDEDDGFLQAGGFRISHETAKGIRSLDLTKTELRTGRALIIDRVDQPIGPGLAHRLEDLSVPTSVVEQSDYLDMMAEPQFTVVPREILAQIVDWISEATAERQRALDVTSLDQVQSAKRALIRGCGNVPVSEQLVVIPCEGNSGLFGVLTKSTESVDKRRTVILANAGSVHHVGPNRLYVELAHTLASNGHSVLRLDLSVLGDSRMGSPADENHPYPSSAIDEVGDAISWLSEEEVADDFVVAGLCSGAHTAFHSGVELEEQPIAGLILLNPLTFRYVKGMSLRTPASDRTIAEGQYYRDAVRDRSRWRRLMRGEADLTRIAGFVIRHAWDRTLWFWRNAARSFGLWLPSGLDGDLRHLESLGRSVHFVISRSDPGREILRRDAHQTVTRLAARRLATITSIPDADHTFSKRGPRSSAIDATVRAVTSIPSLNGERSTKMPDSGRR